MRPLSALRPLCPVVHRVDTLMYERRLMVQTMHVLLSMVSIIYSSPPRSRGGTWLQGLGDYGLPMTKNVNTTGIYKASFGTG
jgi:hypothetical protein